MMVEVLSDKVREGVWNSWQRFHEQNAKQRAEEERIEKHEIENEGKLKKILLREFPKMEEVGITIKSHKEKYANFVYFNQDNDLNLEMKYDFLVKKYAPDRNWRPMPWEEILPGIFDFD
jgi:hypothetical protein